MASKSASEEGQRAMKALATKLDRTVALWRNRLREQTAPRSDSPEVDVDAAQSDLRQQLVGLEHDATELRTDLNREAIAASQWEQRAMTAVQDGDDSAAREALDQQQRHSDAAAAVQAELTLLHAMQQACRDVLENIHYQAATKSRDLKPPSNEEL